MRTLTQDDLKAVSGGFFCFSKPKCKKVSKPTCAPKPKKSCNPKPPCGSPTPEVPEEEPEIG